MMIKSVEATDYDATCMMAALSSELKQITGNSGRSSFNIEDMDNDRSLFVVAYETEKPVGCGALKQIDNTTAEIKRVYAQVKGVGVGKEIVRYLEQQAILLGYQKLLLETRKANERAIAFYTKQGYNVCQNYGKYQGRSEAICFEKVL